MEVSIFREMEAERDWKRPWHCSFLQCLGGGLEVGSHMANVEASPDFKILLILILPSGESLRLGACTDSLISVAIPPSPLFSFFLIEDERHIERDREKGRHLQQCSISACEVPPSVDGRAQECKPRFSSVVTRVLLG